MNPFRDWLRAGASRYSVEDAMVGARFVKCVLRSTMPLASFTCLVDECDFQDPSARIVWRTFAFVVDYVDDVYGHEGRLVAWQALSDWERSWLDAIPWMWGDSDYNKILGRAAAVRYRSRRRTPRWPMGPKETER